MKNKLEQQQETLRNLIPLIKNIAGSDDQLNDLNIHGDYFILGAGKASVQMAEAVIDQLGYEPVDGIIITNQEDTVMGNLQIFKGSHPLPDELSVSASYELMETARAIPAGSSVIFCLSGGASAMLTIPPDGIEIDELADTHSILLNSGASIHEMNTVRKHLCMLKGGQLAQILHHTELTTLLISDVPGDDPEVIGSGPTICDSSTFKDAFQVLKRYSLWEKVPHSVRIHIAKGMGGDIPDTPKPGVNEHPSHTVELISDAGKLANRIGEELKEQGYHVQVADSAYNDELKAVSKKICTETISVLNGHGKLEKPAALVFFGESMVNVSGSGKGGRNQEMALTIALSLEGQHPVSVLSIGTAGLDGPTDAAGAIVTSNTTLEARKQKVEPEKYLQNNDSYHFHETMGTLIKTRPTGNNLMDLQVLLIG